MYLNNVMYLFVPYECCPREVWFYLWRDSHYLVSQAVDRSRSDIVYYVTAASVHTCGHGQGSVQ